MKFFDLSVELSEKTMPWPGDIRFERTETRGSAITSKITVSSHTGTHIDAPKHFVFGAAGIDKIPVSKLVGKAKVIQIQSFPAITLLDIKNINPQRGDKILFKTKNSRLLRSKKFNPNYCSLGLQAAKFLAQKKIDLVGTDYLGIEAKSAPGHPVHKVLLKADIVIVEGLNLSRVKPGKYNLAALPLRIKDGDGSPARVVLWI